MNRQTEIEDDFNILCKQVAEHDKRIGGNHQPSTEEREELLKVVNRIGIAIATNNGDPILSEVHISTNTAVNLSPKTAAELDEALPIAVDAGGRRYYSHVRMDGRGQLNIRSTDGKETTIKFTIPPLQRDKDSSLREKASHKQSVKRPSLGSCLGDLILGHPIAFLLLGSAFAFNCYQFFATETISATSLIIDFFAIDYFLFASFAMRFLIAGRPMHVAVSLVACAALWFGWIVVHQIGTGASAFQPSLLVLISVGTAFQVMRHHSVLH